jgi:hypothetical protein
MDISKLQYESVEEIKKSYLQKINSSWNSDSSENIMSQSEHSGLDTRKSIKVTDLDQAASEMSRSYSNVTNAQELDTGYSYKTSCDSESNEDDEAAIHNVKQKLVFSKKDHKRGRFGSEESYLSREHGHFSMPPSRAVSLDQVVFRPQPVPEKLDFTALEKFEGKFNLFQ